MARTIKEEEYTAKRNQILDFALSLIYSKGYTQMTIQDILDGLQISRGSLYHYFDSKQAMLEALVDHMMAQAEQIILPIVEDPKLSALQKFQGYFEASGRWKNMQKDFIVTILRMWYEDENIFIRHKLTSESMKRTPRLIEPIIVQGIEEKVFNTRFPEQAANLIIGIALSLTNSILELMFQTNNVQGTYYKLEIILDAYTDAIERILGASPDSLQIFDKNAFRGWFDPIEPGSAQNKSIII